MYLKARYAHDALAKSFRSVLALSRKFLQAFALEIPQRGKQTRDCRQIHRSALIAIGKKVRLVIRI